MKYIRTEDGIHEVKSWHDYDLSGRVYETTDKRCIDTIEVKKTADDIKELIDEEIIVWEDGSMEFANRGYDGKAPQGEIKEIYGAIFIKGEHKEPILKSVAKMNGKGDYELL